MHADAHAEVADRLAVAVEHVFGDAIRLALFAVFARLPRNDARLRSPLDDGGEVALDRHRTPAAVLRVLGPESNDAAVAVNVRPFQRHELAPPPGGEVREASEVL